MPISHSSEPESNRFYKMFLESPEPIAISKSDGEIVEANAAFFCALEFDREEVIGKTSASLGIWRYAGVRARLMEQFRRDGKVSNAEIDLCTKSGKIRTQLVSLHPITFPEGDHLLWFFRDITETRQLESQLRQSQRMESIGTLAGGIAHDFNNILAIIFGYCELAKTENPSPAVQRYIDEILGGAKRARDLVKQILAFSRRGESSRTAVQLSAILGETIRLMKAALPATITIAADIEDDATVMADSSQLHQVFMNLLTNAFYAMRKSGGTLSVQTHRFDAHGSGSIAIDISDTGHGIPTPLIERIFEPYFTTKPINEGTGLGLSVVHGIVSEIGGTITVDSEEGTGTKFRIVLPTEHSNAPVPGEELANGHRAARTGGRLLFVDDEPHIARVYERLLTAHHFDVLSLTDSKKAASIFRRNPDAFDIIVTDQTMPGMTGIELADEIRNIREDIPIILCTGYSDLVSEETAKSHGVYAFLLKPVAPESLTDTIETALSQRDAAGSSGSAGRSSVDDEADQPTH